VPAVIPDGNVPVDVNVTCALAVGLVPTAIVTTHGDAFVTVTVLAAFETPNEVVLNTVKS